MRKAVFIILLISLLGIGCLFLYNQLLNNNDDYNEQDLNIDSSLIDGIWLFSDDLDAGTIDFLHDGTVITDISRNFWLPFSIGPLGADRIFSWKTENGRLFGTTIAKIVDNILIDEDHLFLDISSTFALLRVEGPSGIVGRWQIESTIGQPILGIHCITFNEDGNGWDWNGPFKWSLVDDILIRIYTSSFERDYIINDNELILIWNYGEDSYFEGRRWYFTRIGNNTDVGEFSYQEILNNLDSNNQHNHFRNIYETRITNTEEAFRLALNEVLVFYNQVKIYYDEDTSMWKFVFWSTEHIGGCQTVFLSANGITKLIIFGE